jgi:hypothetical protein
MKQQLKLNQIIIQVLRVYSIHITYEEHYLWTHQSYADLFNWGN